jgi:ABC-type multidrug transport system fused ATPase/permease subunit
MSVLIAGLYCLYLFASDAKLTEEAQFEPEPNVLFPKSTDEPSIFLLNKLWRFAGDKRPKIILYTTMFIASNSILLLGPIIFGAFIGEIQKNGLGPENILYVLLLLLAIFLKEFFFWVLHGPARVIERMVAFSAMLNYRRYLLAGLFDLRLSWHNEHDSGDTIDKVDKAGEGLFEFGQNIFQIIEIIVKLIGTSAILFFFSPFMGSLVFICAIASLLVILQFDKRLIPQYKLLNEFSNKASAAVFDALSNITTVKILHIESSVLQGVLARYAAPKSLYRSNAVLNEGKWFTGMLLFQCISLVCLGSYVYYQVRMGLITDAGVLSTLFLYLSEFMFVFFRFGSFYEQIIINKNRVANAEPIEKAFLTRESLSRSTNTAPWKHLYIKDLHFRYDDKSLMPNLNHLSFNIAQGERVAIIGESGSGKTTFLKVLHGMYPKASADLILDDKNPIKTSFADIDLNTMLVPQEPEIFSSTIRENITLGIDYDDATVIQAAQLAAFENVIQQLPKGLDSVINEKGVNLSGGQKQRLALTRALLFSKHKELILLDESTSSVDPENEYEIYQNIWQAFAGKSIIASIHKMNLLKLFDRIIMFENGKVVDNGSFNDLLLRNNSFKTMWDEFIAQS